MIKEDPANRVNSFLNKIENYIIMIADLILTLCSFFQEEKSYGVKKPFALILCLPATVHHVVNSQYAKFLS